MLQSAKVVPKNMRIVDCLEVACIGVQVEVVAEVDGWLHCVASNGSKGLVPASYVMLLRTDQQAPPFRANSPSYQVGDFFSALSSSLALNKLADLIHRNLLSACVVLCDILTLRF